MDFYNGVVVTDMPFIASLLLTAQTHINKSLDTHLVIFLHDFSTWCHMIKGASISAIHNLPCTNIDGVSV